MPSVPATKPKTKTSYDDIEVVKLEEDFFVAKIFGDPEPFTFSTDVNFFLQYGVFSLEPGAINQFLYSLLEVVTEDGATEQDIERARLETKRRFVDLLGTTKRLTPERLIQFILDLTEIAGNAPTT